jgi:hypothetical protein
MYKDQLPDAPPLNPREYYARKDKKAKALQEKKRALENSTSLSLQAPATINTFAPLPKNVEKFRSRLPKGSRSTCYQKPSQKPNRPSILGSSASKSMAKIRDSLEMKKGEKTKVSQEDSIYHTSWVGAP